MTYQWALNEPIQELMDFTEASQGHSYISVGSGGSYTSAILGSLLHRETGGLSQAMTPFEFLSLGFWSLSHSVELFSAGGNNQDAIASLKWAIMNEPRELLISCSNKPSQVGTIGSRYEFVRLSEHPLPSGKDGFLATNSIIANTLLTFRSYKNVLRGGADVPSSLEALMCANQSLTDFQVQLEAKFQDFAKLGTLLILHGNWSKPAGIDLESKLVESAILNVQGSDFRNFAHGQHNWIAKRGTDTAVLCLASRDEIRIAEKTLELIPNNIPRALISAPFDGPLAAINLIVQEMYFVQKLGKDRGIDPGRPKIPAFGREIYRLPISRWHKQTAIDQWRVAISRKTSGLGIVDVELWRSALASFLNRLSSTELGGIVFDFDGTLCDSNRRFLGIDDKISVALGRLLDQGVRVGIASGRGKSVRIDLQNRIPKPFWNKVWIGYYNGSEIGKLAQEEIPSLAPRTDPLLEEFLSLCDNISSMVPGVSLEPRSSQISFRSTEGARLSDLTTILLDIKAGHQFDGLKVVQSSHSVDVILAQVSKVNVVNGLAKEDAQNILCIGDMGRWPGNDYELLSQPYSLSVDNVSYDPRSCWNLCPSGHRGVQGTLDYLKALTFANGRMKFHAASLDLEIN